MPRIGIVGDAGLDLTLQTTGNTREKMTATSGQRALGGTGANAAIAAARLGSDVRLACPLGDDSVAGWVRHELRRAGIGLDHVIVVPGMTEVSVILLEAAGRRLIVEPGVAYEYSLSAAADLGAWADLVYLSKPSPEFVVALAKQIDVPLVLGLEADDLSSHDRWPEAFRVATVVIGNEVTGPTLLDAAEGLPISVVTTLGSQGASLWREGRDLSIPTIPVNVVDATGAGDCLAGALCHFLAQGLAQGDALKLAVVAASLSTTGIGAQSAMPSETEVLARAALKSPRD